jgi:hypothetical protein
VADHDDGVVIVQRWRPARERHRAHRARVAPRRLQEQRSELRRVLARPGAHEPDATRGLQARHRALVERFAEDPLELSRLGLDLRGERGTAVRHGM